jgi:hypothetical protein
MVSLKWLRKVRPIARAENYDIKWGLPFTEGLEHGPHPRGLKMARSANDDFKRLPLKARLVFSTSTVIFP